MNNVFLIGRLTRNPELRTTASGKSTTTFTIAVNDGKNADGEPITDFISCVAWNKTADNICKYLKKGNEVSIQGKIKTRTYDAEDGTKRYVTEVLCYSAYFLSGTGKKEETKEETPQPTPQEEDSFNGFSGEVTLSDEDLPF